MSDRPEDVDAAFAAIVADLEREGLGANVQPDTEPTEEIPHPPVGPVPEPPASWRAHDTEWDWSWGSDDEHYVPPEPPPLPRLRGTTIVALILVVAGVVLLLAPTLIGLDPSLGTPLSVLSLLSLVCGFGLLFLRIRRTPPDSDHDNGAQV